MPQTPVPARLMRRFGTVQPAMALVADSLDRDVSLQGMAEAAVASPFHLHRVFSDVAKETPKQYSLRLRLGRAAAMLLAGDETVLRVALASGFQSHEGFTRAFRRRFGMAPSAYRARGFASQVSAGQGRDHVRLVTQIGPCVALYHLREHEERRETEMPYSVAMRELSPQPVLVERRRVGRDEIAATIADVVSRLFRYAQREGIALAGKPFTRYVDVGAGLLTIEPGLRVADSGGPERDSDPGASADGELAGVRRDELPGGLVASTVHNGPYETLHAAYAALETWMESEGLTPAGAPWEAYITDPAEHPDPQDWQTEVHWPVR